MKKLMFAVSAALCATVGFSDVTSANIVGYQGIDSEAKSYPAMGFTFKPVGTSNTCLLKNFKADGMDPDTDALQVLNPANTQTTKFYTYFSKETAEDWGWDEFKDCIGWWEIGNYGDPALNYDEEPITRGQGFLLLNGLNNAITIQANGEVPQDADSLTFTESYPMLANYLPVDFYLKELKTEGMGMDPDTDALQVLNPANTQTVKFYTYFSVETAEDWGWDEFKDSVGWWEIGNYGDPSFYYGDEVIKAGQGFILLNGLNHEITVDFPGALDVDPIKDAE